MPTLFPGAIDTFTNPTSTSPRNNPSLAAQCSNANDSIAALEAKVGATSSAVTTSHDYKLSGVTGSDKAVSRTGTETLTNKSIDAGQLTGTVSVLRLNAGATVQAVHTQSGAFASGTTLIPIDDTIPQITEGTEFITVSITPTSATNKLLIEHIGMYEINNSDQNITCALFQDATANALAAIGPYQNVARNRVIMNLRHEMVAGTTSAITFRIRVGANNAGTIAFNGSGARLYGGVAASSLRVTEIKV